MANALSTLVNVVISLLTPGLTAPGFGTPMILSYSAAWPERVRTYTSLAGVLADFAATTPEYLAAAKIFAAQPNSPAKIRIGRCALKPSKVITVALAAVTVGAAYTIRAFFTGASTSAASMNTSGALAWVALTVQKVADVVTNDAGKQYVCITAGTNAGAGGPTGTGADITDGTTHWMYTGVGGVGALTNDSLAYQLMTMLNGLAAVNFTAALTGSVTAKIITVTGNAPGNWFALEPLGTVSGAVSNLMNLAETTADPGVATDLTAINTEQGDWYGLSAPFNSLAYLEAVAAWTETAGKLYPAATADTAVPNTADGGASDVVHALKGLSYSYSWGFYHPRLDEFPDAAELGRWMPVNPGKDNWTLKSLVGVSAVAYTATQITNLNAKRAHYYYALAGLPVVGGNGYVAGVLFGYVDVRRFLDWFVVNFQTDAVNALYANEKIGYTDAGIAILANILRARIDLGVQAGGINPNTGSVTAPLVASVPSADKASRTLNNLNAAFQLAGAIDSMTVNLTVTQ